MGNVPKKNASFSRPTANQKKREEGCKHRVPRSILPVASPNRNHYQSLATDRLQVNKGTAETTSTSDPHRRRERIKIKQMAQINPSVIFNLWLPPKKRGEYRWGTKMPSGVAIGEAIKARDASRKRRSLERLSRLSTQVSRYARLGAMGEIFACAWRGSLSSVLALRRA